MKRVKVNGPGVKLANKWCYIGDEATIDEEEFEKNKPYVDVIEDMEEVQEPQGEENPEGKDEELEALKDRAKELGINVTHNMKKETIIKKIEEIEQDAGENLNPEGE